MAIELKRNGSPVLLKACLEIIRKGCVTGYAPNLYNELAYQQLTKKERALIDNIYKCTFGWE